MIKINLYIIEYAVNSLLRQKVKSVFIFCVFTMLISLITAVFFIANAIHYELNTTVNKLPEITVQKIKAGKTTDIELDTAREILTIAGVEDVVSRVWGYYYFENAGVNFSMMGIDNFETQYANSLQKVIDKSSNDVLLDDSSMLIGQGVKKILDQNYYKTYFNFIKPDGEFKQVKIAGVFNSNIELQSNDMILVSKDLAYEIFGLDENYATDLVVKVANPEEIPTIADKIKTLYPNTRVITKDDFIVSYQNIFDYKSGLFLALFIISLFTFFMIIYDKTSGLTSAEKKEIGILKAVGWSVDDVLKEKFYEGFIISFLAYLSGVIISFIYVYVFNAPLLRYIFEGYSQLKTTFTLPFVVDIQTLALVFFITVPVYIAATIIPSWRTATLDADEVIR